MPDHHTDPKDRRTLGQAGQGQPYPTWDVIRARIIRHRVGERIEPGPRDWSEILDVTMAGPAIRRAPNGTHDHD